jgi:two-component system response regulator HydG
VSEAEPQRAVEAARAIRPDGVLLDADVVSERSGEPIRALRRAHDCVCALLVSEPTGHTVQLADAVDADAVLTRPLDHVALRRVLAYDSRRAREPSERSPLHLPPTIASSGLEMRRLWRLVLLAAQHDASVVLRGETGAGKELMARVLHRFSARRAGPFVPVNCAALPEGLLESELFGHEKGAFTGAVARHIGMFERASGGTLLLDEIGELSPELQAKLLRALQERRLERVGGTKTVPVDLRVIAATNRDLEHEVQRGRFRADLFYRLNVLSIEVPPLRQRRSEILELWDGLIADIAAAEDRRAPETSAAATRRLLRHDWPGNVRELENAARHVMMLASGDAITPADLPDYLSEHADAEHAGPSCLGWTLREIERAAILEAYEALGSARAAADMLQISPRKVHYKLREYRQEVGLTGGARAAKASRGTARTRVLLAEDDDDLRWTLAEFLTAEGFDVVQLSGGSDLLEELGSSMLLGSGAFPADAIVSDLRMPGLTGLQILERIRARGWKIPVVIISAYGDDHTRRAVERFDGKFLSKPVDPGALRSVLGPRELSQS